MKKTLGKWISLVSSAFTKNLSTSDDTVQKAMETLDQLDESDPLSLHLNQSIPQTVTNGVPVFNEGIKSNGPIILKAGQKLIFDGE